MSQQQQTNKQQKTSNMHILWSDGNNSILSCHTIVSFDFYTRKLINKIVYYRKLARATRRKPIRVCISNIPVGEWRRLLHTQNMPLSSLSPFVECDCLCARASAPFFMCCRFVVDSTKSSFYKQSFRVRVNTLKHIEYRKSILNLILVTILLGAFQVSSLLQLTLHLYQFVAMFYIDMAGWCITIDSCA